MLKERIDAKRKLIPTTGFNVVAVDDFELPGEELYLVGHYATRKEAEAELKRFRERNTTDVAYIYGPDTL